MADASAFLDAVADGNVGAVERLLGEQPSLASSRSGDGVSAVLVALYRGHRGVVDVIVAAGADLDVFAAAALGHTDRVAILLDLDPTLVTAWSADGFTPLHLAAFFGHPATASLLVGRGAEVDAEARNAMAVRPLHSAVAAADASARLEVARLLIEAGADVNAEQAGGYTALFAANHHGDDELARVLTDAGATG